MVGKQVLSTLRPSRKSKKGETDSSRQSSVDIGSLKRPSLPSSSTQSKSLSGYYYPWSPSSLDLLVRSTSKSMSSKKGVQSPTLSLELPDSSFGSLFEVPRRKPLPETPSTSPDSSRRGSAMTRTESFRSSLHLSSTFVNPGALDWPIMMDLPTSVSSIDLTSTSRNSSLGSLELPVPLCELPADMEWRSQDLPILAQPLNKPSFRTFCRNRLMLYSPVAENPFEWAPLGGQMIASR